MPDDHSDLVPLLPIPNRTVKRVSADDSADSRVKVGHRQAITARKSPVNDGAFFCLRLAARRCQPTHGDLRPLSRRAWLPTLGITQTGDERRLCGHRVAVIECFQPTSLSQTDRGEEFLSHLSLAGHRCKGVKSGFKKILQGS